MHFTLDRCPELELTEGQSTPTSLTSGTGSQENQNQAVSGWETRNEF